MELYKKLFLMLWAITCYTNVIAGMKVQQQTHSVAQSEAKQSYTQQALAKTLYTILDSMPQELIAIIVGYAWHAPRGIYATIELIYEPIACIATIGDIYIAVGLGKSNNIGVYNLSTKQWRILQGHIKPVTCLASLDPIAENNQKHLLASGSDDASISVWNVDNGDELACLQEHYNSITSLIGFPQNRLVSGSRDHTVKTWNYATQQHLKTLYGCKYSIIAMTALPKDQLATLESNNTITIWDINNAQYLLKMGVSAACCMTCIGNNILAIGSSCIANPEAYQEKTDNQDNIIAFFNLDKERFFAISKAHKGPVTCMTAIANGKLLLSGSYDKTLKIIDPRNNTCHATIPMKVFPTCIALLPGGFAIVGDARGDLNIVSLID